ncbi:MAG: IclR family transcriptional regulator domain-containing protein [Intrasporangium sp.]|uniref:IclR family transcriptional regulator domain-containing protein n=1 Tax=Intrasporangium sp. TaxID=1925024 RepID=UPI003F7FA021
MSEGLERGERTDFVQSVAKTLDVIQAFDADHHSLTLSDVARRTGQSRASARRFLLSLEALGFVRSDAGLFSLTPRVLALGHAFLSSLRLPEIAEPHLKALSQRLGESTSASVFDGDDVVYVARIPARRIMSVAIRVGSRFPAYATSMGRVMLAFAPQSAVEAYLDRVVLEPLTDRTVVEPDALRAELDRVRRQGWAVVDQELAIGLRSVAAPVRNAAGDVVAAINASTTSQPGSGPLDPAVVDDVVATADRISEDLRHASPDLEGEQPGWGQPR